MAGVDEFLSDERRRRWDAVKTCVGDKGATLSYGTFGILCWRQAVGGGGAVVKLFTPAIIRMGRGGSWEDTRLEWSGGSGQDLRCNAVLRYRNMTGNPPGFSGSCGCFRHVLAISAARKEI